VKLALNLKIFCENNVFTRILIHGYCKNLAGRNLDLFLKDFTEAAAPDPQNESAFCVKGI
jgi:hypothetical protein